jgi:hypothetical protein
MLRYCPECSTRGNVAVEALCYELKISGAFSLSVYAILPASLCFWNSLSLTQMSAKEVPGEIERAGA